MRSEAVFYNIFEKNSTRPRTPSTYLNYKKGFMAGNVFNYGYLPVATFTLHCRILLNAIKSYQSSAVTFDETDYSSISWTSNLCLLTTSNHVSQSLYDGHDPSG